MYIFYIFLSLFVESAISYFNSYTIEEYTFNVSAIGKITMLFGVNHGFFILPWGHSAKYKRSRIYGVTFKDIYLQKFLDTKADIEGSLGMHMTKRNQWLKDGIMVSDEFVWDGDDVSDTLTQSPSFPCESPFYIKIMGVCYHLVFRMYYREYFLSSGCEFGFFSDVKLKKIFFSYDVRSQTTMYTFATGKCQLNYYQPSCWLKCISVADRFTCNSITGEEICLSNWEPVKHRYFYRVPTNLFITWKIEALIINRCLFFNPCAYARQSQMSICPNKGDCYPIFNASFTCLEMIPTYILSNNNETNYTMESLVSNDFLLFTYELVGPNNHLVKNVSYCRWATNVGGIYVNLDIYTNTSIIRVSNIILYGRYFASVVCDIGQFRSFTYYRTFNIYEMPKNILLHNLSAGHEVDVFIGQVVWCTSDTKPNNMAHHLLDITTDNFIFTIQRTSEYVIVIPLSAETGLIAFFCQVTFKFLDARPPMVFRETYFHYLKTYIRFDWIRQYKNIYTSTDSAGCNLLAYFTGYLSVKLLKGPSAVSILSPTNFSTKVVSGGVFFFLCILNIKDGNKLYYRTNQFEIFKYPDFICLLLSMPTLGSFLRCGHNGYPRDYASFTLRLSIGTVNYATSSAPYIKIPYFFKLFKFNFSCEIMYTVNKVSSVLRLKKEIRLNIDLSVKVVIEEEDEECAIYSEHLIDNVVQLSDSSLFLMAEVLCLEIFTIEFEHTFVIYLFAFGFMCSMTVFNAILPRLKRDSLSLHLMYFRRRVINDKLNAGTRLDVVGREKIEIRIRKREYYTSIESNVTK